MELTSLAKYAKRHGVKPQAATKWRKSGYLVLIGRMVDVKASDAKLKANMLGKFKPAKLVDGLVDGSVDETDGWLMVDEGETAAAAAERILSTGGAQWDFSEAKRVKENYLALLNQLDYDIKSGEVVLVSDVAKAVGAQFAIVRTKLLGLAANNAPRLFNLRSVNELNQALYELVVDALEALSLEGVQAD